MIPELEQLELCEDERVYLSFSERCVNCGHLSALHNSHCCVFCTMPDCECYWFWEFGYVPSTSTNYQGAFFDERDSVFTQMYPAQPEKLKYGKHESPPEDEA